MRSKDRCLVGLFFAGLFVAALFFAGAATAQDQVLVGAAEGPPGSTVRVPLEVRDRPGTALDTGDPLASVQGLSVTVRPVPAAAVRAIDFRPAGVAQGVATRFETQVSSGAERSWIVSFAAPLDLAAVPRQVGELDVELAPGVAPGTVVELVLVRRTTALSNGDGRIVESAQDPELALRDGRVTVAGTSGCTGGTTLCLLDDRFLLEIGWNDGRGTSGVGFPVQLTSDSGYFWFFNEKNVEIVVKALDGRGLNGNFWVFYGALTNVEFTLRVTDSVTGATREYKNPLGTFASVGDTGAFSGDGAVFGAPWTVAPWTDRRATASKGTCVADAESLCFLDGRFRATMRWANPHGVTGTGKAVSLTDETGYFWFFNRENVEVVVKVLDGRAITGHFWVFYGALSNVEFELEVTDTETGDVRVFKNPQGTFASVGDTEAF